ncbi:MAG: hydrogenase iron-sulfur subunit [Thermoplasmata archaeon]
MEKNKLEPKILVFSTNTISDPGIDLAGMLKLHYPSTVYIINVPCSSIIKPKWILHALQCGFDGVFIAADGTDCPCLSDCTERTSKNVENAQKLMIANGIDPARVKMAAICSVCSEAFVNHIKYFYGALKNM